MTVTYTYKWVYHEAKSFIGIYYTGLAELP
jgi:hypothetical protein